MKRPKALFKPANHIVGKTYDLTQDNMRAMITYIEHLEKQYDLAKQLLAEADESIEKLTYFW